MKRLRIPKVKEKREIKIYDFKIYFYLMIWHLMKYVVVKGH